MGIVQRLKSLWFDRRRRNDPVSFDRRRRRSKRKEVEQRCADALDDFAQTTSMSRDDDLCKRVANDVQQEVQFDTFRAICRFQIRQGEYILCRNPSHEAANTGIAKCDEQLCPFMRVQRDAA